MLLLIAINQDLRIIDPNSPPLNKAISANGSLSLAIHPITSMGYSFNTSWNSPGFQAQIDPAEQTSTLQNHFGELRQVVRNLVRAFETWSSLTKICNVQWCVYKLR